MLTDMQDGFLELGGLGQVQVINHTAQKPLSKSTIAETWKLKTTDGQTLYVTKMSRRRENATVTKEKYTDGHQQSLVLPGSTTYKDEVVREPEAVAHGAPKTREKIDITVSKDVVVTNNSKLTEPKQHACFDEKIVEDASFEDMDSGLINHFRTSRTRDNQRILAQKLGMAGESANGELRPTVTGILLGTKEPRRWLQHSFIQAVAYPGRSTPESLKVSGHQFDKKNITGSLDIQIADACRFVASNQKIYVDKKIGRIDLPQYDLTAIFEAIVNAVAHRDYSIHDSSIRLWMFSDRVELYSPGKLTGMITVETLSYRQANRNDALTNLLSKCPVPSGIPELDTQRATIMDRRGEGVGIILEKSEKLSGHCPKYELLNDSELLLTIFAANPEIDDKD